ncbi:NUDIX hydrolase [Patescibacteria group bacterium]
MNKNSEKHNDKLSDNPDKLTGNADKDRQAVAIVFNNPKDNQQVFLAMRPDDPTDVSCNCWGFPAATLGENESFEQAIIRIGQDKLGLTIKPLEMLSQGEADRVTYNLHLELWRVEARGQLSIKKTGRPDITYYSDWKWGDLNDLGPAEVTGSLGSKLYRQWIEQLSQPSKKKDE